MSEPPGGMGGTSGTGEVETERLLLRRWRRSDLDRLVDLFAQPDFWWFPFKAGRSSDDAEDFLDRKLGEWSSRGWSQWAVEVKDDGNLIGFLGLAPPDFLPEVMPTVEVGWRLDSQYWGQGLATEGGRAAIDFGFAHLGLDHVVSIYEPDNVASQRVMQKLGMRWDRDTTHPTLHVPLTVYRLDRAGWDALDVNRRS